MKENKSYHKNNNIMTVEIGELIKLKKTGKILKILENNYIKK